MDHKINSVQMLHDDALKLYNNVVIGDGDFSADTILNSILSAINILKSNWEGKDAGIQIQNIITVYNSMIEIRNSLANLAVESSSVASKYRQIQNMNGAGFDEFEVITADNKPIIEVYNDTRDTVNINNEVTNAKTRLEKANDSIDGFVSEVKSSYEEIMDNWVMGPGRDVAQEKFELLIVNSQSYKDKITEVCLKIATALNNYSI